jgi:hypothetical protein
LNLERRNGRSLYNLRRFGLLLGLSRGLPRNLGLFWNCGPWRYRRGRFLHPGGHLRCRLRRRRNRFLRGDWGYFLNDFLLFGYLCDRKFHGFRRFEGSDWWPWDDCGRRGGFDFLGYRQRGFDSFLRFFAAGLATR